MDNILIETVVLIYIYLFYRLINSENKTKKKVIRTSYTERLETDVHLFKLGINGKEDIEDLTKKNLAIIKNKGKPCMVSFIMFPNEPKKNLRKQFESISSLRHITNYPKEIFNVDAKTQQILYENNVWAITGELRYTEDDEIIFRGVALREERDNGEEGYESVYIPMLPKTIKIIV